MTRLVTVLVVTASLMGAGAPPVDGQTILGLVVDERSAAPLPGAMITLLDSAGVAAQSTVTDDGGRFRLTVAPGSYAFSVRRLGYAPFTTALLRVAPDAGAVNVTIAVPVREVVLDPVTVEGEALPFAPGPLEDFERRRVRGMGGLFLTPEDIAVRNPSRATDIFYGLPGVRVSVTGHNRFVVRMLGQAPRLGSPPRSSSSRDRRFQGQQQEGNVQGTGVSACVPTLYVDGVKVIDTDAILNIVLGSEIHAAEVYRRASETPAEFLDSDSRCGVIVLWTKRAPPPRRPPQ